MGGLFSKPPKPKAPPVPTASNNAEEKVAFEVGSDKDPITKATGKKKLTVKRKNTGLGGVASGTSSGLAVSK